LAVPELRMMLSQHMKSTHAEGSTNKNSQTAGVGFEQNQGSGMPGVMRSRNSSSCRGSWWEAGWFKEWERVARHEA